MSDPERRFKGLIPTREFKDIPKNISKNGIEKGKHFDEANFDNPLGLLLQNKLQKIYGDGQFPSLSTPLRIQKAITSRE